MSKKEQQPNRPNQSDKAIWSQHLAWLEVTGQHARANRERSAQQRCGACGRQSSY